MSRKTSLRIERLEGREVPSGTRLFAFGEEAGASRVAVYLPSREYVVSNTTFGSPDFLQQEGTLLRTLTPFEGFHGGVRVAVGDVTGDSVDDIVVAAGAGGGPHVKVYGGSQLLNGKLTVVADFFAYDAAFRGGVYVAVGQMDPLSPQQEIIVGAGQGGGPHVRVFALDGVLFTVTPGTPAPEYYFARMENEFFAFAASFRGGVRVAAGDVTGDGRAELIAAAGPGGGPEVRVFDVNHPDPLALPAYKYRLLERFNAYDAGFRGGVYVAAGQVTGDATAEIVTGPGEGGGPHIKLFGHNAVTGFHTINEAYVGSPARTGGIHVGLADLGYNSAAANPTARPSFVYYSAGYDPAATQLPTDREPRVGGFNFTLGSFVPTHIYLPLALTDDNTPINMGL